jgi:uncharacterized protein (TIGR03790 family)
MTWMAGVGGSDLVDMGASGKTIEFYMVKTKSILWFCKWRLRVVAVLCAAGAAANGLALSATAESIPAPASAASPAAEASAVAPSSAAQRRVTLTPQLPGGRLQASQIGLVVNTADPYSVAVGDYYAARRHIAADHVLRLRLPLQASLSEGEFDDLAARITAFFKPDVQALALAWTAPYAVQCNSITGALALGFDRKLCLNPCERSRKSPYFGAVDSRPFGEHGIRPAMLIAAPTLAQARALIDRGVAADGKLGLRGAPPARALLVTTHDQARNVRAETYPPAGFIDGRGVEIIQMPAENLKDQNRLLLVEIGAAQVAHLDSLTWLPGALADHLTSFGGDLRHATGQMSSLAWIASGATATYGTVSEPCNHLQKFPNPRLLLLSYLHGQTAIEAYWKSVEWPQQGLFIGEPLAAPFAPAGAQTSFLR